MKIVRDSRVGSAATTALILVLLAGNGWFLTTVMARLGYLTLPAALGLPAGLPGLRFWPLGEVGVLLTIGESVAALVFVAVIAAWIGGTVTRHVDARPLRLFGSAVAAAIVAGVTAGAIRLVVTSFIQSTGPGVYLGYVAAVTVITAIWGLLAGILIGAVTASVGSRRPIEVIDEA
ncbi:hypothetical protein [Stackebrandtia soli]|uniref:hypothetical protein n=1 Tax=Stackebrandtia soli TaxID=1892856 RepID=UPI0039EA8F10